MPEKKRAPATSQAPGAAGQAAAPAGPDNSFMLDMMQFSQCAVYDDLETCDLLQTAGEGPQTPAVPPTGGGPELRGKSAGEGKAPGAATVDDADVKEPDLPKDFTQESVLVTWIGEFNKSLKKRGQAKLKELQQLGWADDNGLNLELLKAAAAQWEPPKSRSKSATGEAKPEATPVTTAKILAMLSSSNRVLRKVITPDYSGKCLEFSAKMLTEMGAKRADGTGNKSENRGAKPGPLTAKYRGKAIKDLPKDLPAGYQICVTSMPEWGFTEVGNHWFVSAGDGFYLDNTAGVVDGAGMTANLKHTTGDQWGRRVVDLEQNPLRNSMGKKFVEANPQFARYSGEGRTGTQRSEKVKGKANPDFRAPDDVEKTALAAIKAFVLANPEYHPRIWLVEPTTKIGDAGGDAEP